MQGGRGSGKCADGTTVINLISLCSHTDTHPNLNREVRHSLTWHSSKSESALERFEPVAADKLRLDGSLAMFAPEGDGCLNRARREDAGRIHKAGTTLCDFWYFWSYKSTIKEKFLYVKDNTSSTAIAVPLLPLEKALYPLFLLHMQAQKKKLSKRKRQWGDFALCEARRGLRVLDLGTF